MPIPSPAVAADLAEISERLRALAQGRDPLDVARIQFIGLDEIREGYGPRWASHEARIHETAETFLRHRIGADDLMVRGRDGFLIVFASAQGVDAQLRASQLAHGLNAFYLGEAGLTPPPRVGAVAMSISVKDLVAQLADRAFVAAAPQTPAPAEPAASHYDWRYQPVWDVKRETLTNWYVIPFRKGANTRVPGYQFEPGAMFEAQYPIIDDAALWVAQQALGRMIEDQHQALLGTSIHVSSMTNLAVRSKILQALDQLDPRLSRFRVLKLAAVPPGFPRHHLSEMVAMLRRRIANVVIGAAWDDPDFEGLATCDAAAIGMSIPPWVLAPTSKVSRTLLHARIAEALSVAHAARKRLFVEGGVTVELANRLRALGVDNISAPAIWEPRDEPGGMLKWPAERLTA